MTIDAPDRWGGPSRLSAWESLMWRAEGDPRTRSTGILLEILATEPDWDRFYRAHDRTVTKIPRLRERIVEPILPVTEPAWSADEAFNLDLHVHRVALRGPGGEDELFELIESTFNRPLDRARPPWEATLVTGLAGGQAAYLVKFHHSLSDGLGLVQLLTMAHSPTSRPSPVSHTIVAPARPVHGPLDLLSLRAKEAVAAAPGQVLAAMRTGLAGRALPSSTTRRSVRYLASAKRSLSPPSVGRSPLLADAGVGNRLLRPRHPAERPEGRGQGRRLLRERRFRRRHARRGPALPRAPPHDGRGDPHRHAGQPAP